MDVLLLDKTGTITLGNRQATEFIPAAGGVPARNWPTRPSSPPWPTRPPRAAASWSWPRKSTASAERDIHALGATFVPFTAQTRMSGVNLDGRQIRKGAADAVEGVRRARGRQVPAGGQASSDAIARAAARRWSSPTARKVLGVIQLKDIVKGGIKERFAELRRMGIKTVMITGDNPLTAAAIAAEAGVDDFLAQATPEAKLKLIREYQAGGRLVAMTGDGTNDAPALAQADVAVAMNTGTQAAKEAGNMVDLDSNPTKLIEIVEIGKQLLMTRGALTTFSIANDVAKYFAIIPAAFATTYPALDALNIMHLATPQSAILSAVIFNALIIVALIPLALRGVKYRPLGADGTAAQQPADLRPGRPDRPVHRHQAHRRALVYPLAVTVSPGSWPSPRKASGSLIVRGGPHGRLGPDRPALRRPRYFWGRPSATAPFPTTPPCPRGPTWAPPTPLFWKPGQGPHRGAASADPGNAAPDSGGPVTASASGLDPDISPAAALLPSAPCGQSERAIARTTSASLVETRVKGRPVLGCWVSHGSNVLGP